MTAGEPIGSKLIRNTADSGVFTGESDADSTGIPPRPQEDAVLASVRSFGRACGCTQPSPACIQNDRKAEAIRHIDNVQVRLALAIEMLSSRRREARSDAIKAIEAASSHLACLARTLELLLI